jgi:hypothetical protein
VLAELNERLDNPPVMDVSVSRHMGLFAVGRLAERHGIRVRLRARPPQGLIAMVWLPDSVIQQNDRQFGRVHPALRQLGTQGRRTVSAGSRSSLPAQAALPTHAPAPPREAMPRESVPREAMPRTAVASSRWFSDPRAQAGGPLGTSGQPSRPAEQPNGGAHFGAAAQIVADPARGDQTRSGLPMRAPGANLIPGSIDSSRRADSSMSGYQADRHESQPPGQGLPQRSPEITRSRISGFQRGVRRGKSQVPGAGEGIDR